MGHGPARRRGWSYLQGCICSYLLLVCIARICGSYVLVVPVSRICLGTRADFSGDHPHSGRYRADCILPSKLALGQILLEQFALGQTLLGQFLLG